MKYVFEVHIKPGSTAERYAAASEARARPFHCPPADPMLSIA